MKKLMLILLLTGLTTVNAALATDYLIYEQREKDGQKNQNEALVEIEGKVTSVKLEYLSNMRPPLVKVYLKIRPVAIIRKPSKLSMPREVSFVYSKIDHSTGWVGPARQSKRTPMIPKEGKTYTFYLNEDLSFTANEYSIEPVQ